MSLLRKILWVCYLAISLVFIQAAGVHVHVYNHDAGTAEHHHHEQAHLGFDVAETGHADEVAEVDVSQQGLLKNISSTSLVMVLFTALLLVLLTPVLIQLLWRDHRRVLLSSWPVGLRPPLRAPPL